MSEVQTSISTLIPIFTAIADRNWQQFKNKQQDFVEEHGVDVWEEVFNFQVKPALDKDSDRWLLVQWCNQGNISTKDVA